MRETQEELSAKTSECKSQQEEITSLFSQIFELQARIKTLSQNNNDLKSTYETSTSELLTELDELKQKYNECIKQLNKTQDELISLRKKSGTPTRTSPATIHHNHRQANISKSTNTNSSQLNSCEFDDSCLVEEPVEMAVRANSNSLATELFCSLARDYRARNLYKFRFLPRFCNFMNKPNFF